MTGPASLIPSNVRNCIDRRLAIHQEKRKSPTAKVEHRGKFMSCPYQRSALKDEQASSLEVEGTREVQRLSQLFRHPLILT